MNRQPIKQTLPKCRYHKTRFYPSTGSSTQQYCLKDKDCREAAEKAVMIKLKAKRENELKESNKDWNRYKKERRPFTHAKENKAQLQSEINKLARMIDLSFGFRCVDCDRAYGLQVDGAHFHSRGANSSLRWNLHNIHAADSECNQFDDEHKPRYRKGLAQRYGSEYLELVDGLPLKYPKIKLSEVEVFEKLSLVRKLIRTFDTFVFQDAIQARTTLNNLIGIYN